MTTPPIPGLGNPELDLPPYVEPDPPEVPPDTEPPHLITMMGAEDAG